MTYVRDERNEKLENPAFKNNLLDSHDSRLAKSEK